MKYSKRLMSTRGIDGGVLTLTATRGPVTELQLCAMVDALEDFWRRGFRVMRHGDCEGGDAVGHCIARAIGYRITIHPPSNSSKRAFMRRGTMMRPLPYLQRNGAMVNSCLEVLACPKTESEELRAGTWATIRYARKYGRPVTFCYPSGRRDPECRACLQPDKYEPGAAAFVNHEGQCEIQVMHYVKGLPENTRSWILCMVGI